MGLYVAPALLKQNILDRLDQEYPKLKQSERLISFEEAKALVEKVCVDLSEVQPAVKLPSFYHEYVYSIWFGAIFHFYPERPDPITCKFLFHGQKQMDPWSLVEFTVRRRTR
jgi:hypothetical protein